MARFAAELLAIALALGEGYVTVDPGHYDSSYAAQKSFDEQRTVKECFCGKSVHSSLWTTFYQQLQQNLAEDPSFTGDWVHQLCGTAYPVIFRVVSLEADDTFTLSTDCPAGVLSMVVVCAQSAALQHQAGPQSEPVAFRSTLERLAEAEVDLEDWGVTPRVVLQEGEAVGDFFGEFSLKECISHCNRVARCLSISHGPFGCHLKARCVGSNEPMVPEGEQGADYHTVYRKSCGGPRGEKLQTSSTSAGRSTHMEELQNMMGMALRALEFCLHCLDASPWPFLLSEILENYALAVEAPEQFLWLRASGRHLGPSTQPAGGDSLEVPESLALLGNLPPLRLNLLRLQVRWIRGLEMEAQFWRGKLSRSPEENVSLERLLKWLKTGEVPWTLPGDDLCQYLAQARAGSDRLPRILNAGSGPLAPRPLRCQLPDAKLAEPVPVIAADGLARFYLKVLDERGMTPPYLPVQCPVEELPSCFPAAYFDLVHIRNALDHSFDPLLGILQMLRVARPNGWVLLRHARNEGVAGKFRNGLHQWAFDVEGPSDNLRFLIWNPDLRLDVSTHLLQMGVAAEVRTRLLDHPNGADAPEDEKYVWVEIRKPKAQELAAHLRQKGSG